MGQGKPMKLEDKEQGKHDGTSDCREINWGQILQGSVGHHSNELKFSSTSNDEQWV